MIIEELGIKLFKYIMSLLNKKAIKKGFTMANVDNIYETLLESIDIELLSNIKNIGDACKCINSLQNTFFRDIENSSFVYAKCVFFTSCSGRDYFLFEDDKYRKEITDKVNKGFRSVKSNYGFVKGKINLEIFYQREIISIPAGDTIKEV